MDGPWRLLRTRDPQWITVRRALRGAAVVPTNFAIGFELIGKPQVATFAAFGSFGLLLFANLPGGIIQRFGEYLVLGAAGAGAVTLGSAVSTPNWLAIVSVAVLAFLILFAGIVSSVINGSTQVVLLALLLAVLLPGGRPAIPDRLTGWALACGVSIPVALFVWPPRDRDVLRHKTASLCRALAEAMRLDQTPEQISASLIGMSEASRNMRTAFRNVATRTAALSTGSRLVIRLVNELDWLASVVAVTCAEAPADWPEEGRRLRMEASQVLLRCAEVLEHPGDGPTPTSCGDLGGCISALDGARAAVATETLRDLQARTLHDAAGEFERPLYAAKELGDAVALVAGTVSSVAAADRRNLWARLTGREVVLDEAGVVAAAQRVATGHLDRHSVWLQNSIRGAAGLAFAVLLARIFDAQNAFWIGLGALSVLRSNAVSTGATVLRALVGTAVGFAIGGGIVSVLGTGHALLWTLLPIVVFVSALAPTVIPFIAGQASFTVFSIVLFNIVAPRGWHIGVTRAEDVVLGCVASLVAGVLFWPRGAGAALARALADAYRSAAALLERAVDHLTNGDTAPDVQEAAAAGHRLDDALRQYLAEQGGKRVPLETVSTLASAAGRLRYAGLSVSSLDGASTPRRPDVELQPAADILDRRAHQVASWYAMLAAAFTSFANPLPPPALRSDDESFVEVVLPALDRCGDEARAQHAELLLWTGQYVGDVDRLRADIIDPAHEVVAAVKKPWWHF